MSVKIQSIPKLIFQTKAGIKNLGFIDKIKDLYKYLIRIIYYNSLTTEKYYQDISTNHLKKNLKNMLRFCIIYWNGLILIQICFDSRDIYSILLDLFGIIINLTMYFLTTVFTTNNHLYKLNVTAFVTQFVLILLGISSKIGLVETNFTPTLQLCLLMFSNLHITFVNALILWTCFYGLTILSIKVALEFKFGMGELKSLKPILENIPFYNREMNSHRLLFATFIVGIAATFIFIYIFVMNDFHRRSSFIKLRHNIQAKIQVKSATKVQLHWIDAIMPKVIKDVYLEHSEQIKRDKWVFIQTFENVTILFADIVGFTAISSDKTASTIVALLNDLFNRFDELCNLTNCEKLGTLGDCYYCVSGCPISRPDHAISCIEMGLGMCRIIAKFNFDHREDFEMRVGIHTGRVNAAIIGKKRFRFDVYSNDVIIANTMESSGQPGRVHISEAVYEYVRNTYSVEKGADLEIKREEDYGIAGMLLKSTFIKTYFIDPQSSHLKVDENTFQMKENLQLITLSKNISSVFQESSREHSTNDNEKDDNPQRQEFRTKIMDDITLIDNLRFDPDKKIKNMSSIPIDKMTLCFTDNEIEWHYNISLHQWNKADPLTWLKLSPLVDSCACFGLTILIHIALLILFPTLFIKGKIIIICQNFLSVLIIFVTAYHCYETKYFAKYSLRNLVHLIYSNSVFRSLHCLYFLSAPLIILTYILHDCSRLYIDIYYTVRYFILVFFTILICPVFISSRFLFKILACFINFVVAFSVFCRKPCIRKSLNYTYQHYSCDGQMNYTEMTFQRVMRIDFSFQIFMVFIVMIFIIRELERNIRTLFLVSRENRINYEEASRAMITAQNVLYNILPKYVFNQLKTQPGNEKEIINFNYAVSIPKVGVIFACISNFFSKYYREDYKSGENALRLLHKIICFFDDIIEKEIYKDIEKIKTVNDCYMAASGLNVKQGNKNIFSNEHLSALMHYAFDLIKALENFNENFIIGTDKFEIKIGYNFGPVTAGIIGASKPLYDIWGNTVNVSSRMYSTGLPGKIQVPHYVKNELRKEFKFKYRGKIFVKGKGEMKTFICKGAKLNFKKSSPITQTVAKKSFLGSRYLLRRFYRKNAELNVKPSDNKYSERRTVSKEKPFFSKMFSKSFEIESKSATNSSSGIRNVFIGFTF